MQSHDKKSYQPDRFHYSLWLETVDGFLCGKKPSQGMAAAFSNYSYMKKRLKAITKKIRARVSSVITSDEDLKESLFQDLETLDQFISAISPKHHSEQEIIAKLFTIVARLLGWGVELEGGFIRTPIYFQTKDERDMVLQRRARSRMPRGLLECYERRRLILQMRSENKSYSRIALILSMTETSVKQLESAKYLDEDHASTLERIKLVDEATGRVDRT